MESVRSLNLSVVGVMKSSIPFQVWGVDDGVALVALVQALLLIRW